MAQASVVVLFSGQVQGVGFRYTTCRLAARYEVTGSVCNLPDGTVRVIAEGEPSQLQAFIEAVKKAMYGYIQETKLTWGAASGKYRDFSLTFFT